MTCSVRFSDLFGHNKAVRGKNWVLSPWQLPLADRSVTSYNRRTSSALHVTLGELGYPRHEEVWLEVGVNEGAFPLPHTRRLPLN